MKTFKKITDQLYGARKAGYTFDMTAPRETDDALLDRLSSRMTDNQLDEFYDFDGNLYQGDDGEYYAVKFATFDGQEKPVIWQRLVKEHKTWYALMTDRDDTDWGTGTFDRDEAIDRLRSMREDYPDAYIAVIDDGPDPVCVDEIRDID